MISFVNWCNLPVDTKPQASNVNEDGDLQFIFIEALFWELFVVLNMVLLRFAVSHKEFDNYFSKANKSRLQSERIPTFKYNPESEKNLKVETSESFDADQITNTGSESEI